MYSSLTVHACECLEVHCLHLANRRQVNSISWGSASVEGFSLDQLDLRGSRVSGRIEHTFKDLCVCLIQNDHLKI